ncbi:DUF3106 domain-containing protein [Ideonella sp.]|uniref:DUF3106 domain-containing protein n=1 Tax=Ideonella sp. TaxID=1929293 RepID=UPI0035ADBCFD
MAPFLAGAMLAWALAGPAHAQSAPPGGPAWTQLNPAQQRALEPLQGEWDRLDAPRKQKWLEVASRFDRMSPQRQQRVRERMDEWARMSPSQRTEARLNYQQSKRLPAEDRQARWEAYQALSPEERAALAERATRKPAPVAGGSAAPAQSLRRAPVDAQAPKSNVVAPAQGRLPPPTAVSPSVVQGSRGATTSLVTATPRAPQHQPPGQPKIAASPKLVDRTTLLPKAGPQAAGAQAPQASRPQKQNGPSGQGGR